MFDGLPSSTDVLLIILIGVVARCFWPKDEDWDDDDDNDYDGLHVTHLGAV